MKIKLKLSLIAGILLAGCSQSTVADVEPEEVVPEFATYLGHAGDNPIYRFVNAGKVCFVADGHQSVSITCF